MLLSIISVMYFFYSTVIFTGLKARKKNKYETKELEKLKKFHCLYLKLNGADTREENQ